MLILPRGFIAEMIAHAREEAPNECCGIIAGQGDRAVELFRVKNAEVSPYRYNVDPQDLSRIYRQCDQRGWEFLAIYHSHTVSKAYPSPTDIRLAYWPDALYVIVSLMDRDFPVVRAFHIVDGAVREASGSSLAIGPAEPRRMHTPQRCPQGGVSCVLPISGAGPPVSPTTLARVLLAVISVVGSVLTALATGTSRPSSPSASGSMYGSTGSDSRTTPSPGGVGITSWWRW